MIAGSIELGLLLLPRSAESQIEMTDNSREKTNLIRRIAASKYLRRESQPSSVREIIYWWELRRVPFNLAVGIAGLATCITWLISLILTTMAAPESLNDPELPLVPDGLIFALLGVVLYAIAANVCYTGGWIIEVLLFGFGRKGDLHFGPLTFTLGLVFSILLTLLPTLFIIGYTALFFFDYSIVNSLGIG